MARVIPSEEKLRLRLANRLEKKWVNAGAAHLTTFSHARKNGITHFWNIDADDTIFLQTPEAIARKLAEVEQYALANKLDCFSLDMYWTFQKHWSFGVTFTSLCNADYLTLIDKVDNDELKELYKPQYGGEADIVNGMGELMPGACGNIDWYFTYLRDKGLINARSFYIEDTYFAHLKYRLDFDNIGQLVNGIYYWKDGLLWGRPIAPDCIGFSKP